MLAKRPPPNSHPGSLMASLNTMESQFQTSMLGSEAEYRSVIFATMSLDMSRKALC